MKLSKEDIMLVIVALAYFVVFKDRNLEKDACRIIDELLKDLKERR